MKAVSGLAAKILNKSRMTNFIAKWIFSRWGGISLEWAIKKPPEGGLKRAWMGTAF
jgi:hypothetical protein